jgi:hypothetical protein
MGNGSVGRDSGGFREKIIIVAGNESSGTRNANKCETCEMFF